MCGLTVFSFTELPRLRRGTFKHCTAENMGREGLMGEGLMGEGLMGEGVHSAHIRLQKKLPSYVLQTTTGPDSVRFHIRACSNLRTDIRNYRIDTDRAKGLQLIRTGLLSGRKEVLTHWCIPAK